MASLSLYNRLNYIIQINAPFKDREDRVFQRDTVLKKGMMVIRDKEFRNSLGKQSEKINQKIENNGSTEELQQIADDIYDRKIKPKTKNKTVREKYGCKVEPTIKKAKLINKERRQNMQR